MTSILVTTGATVTFKALLDHIITDEFIRGFLVNQVQCTKLMIQYGNEIDRQTQNNTSKQYFSDCFAKSGLFDKLDLSVANEFNDKSSTTFKSGTNPRFEMVVFPFSNDIRSYIEQANLVISHAGTGSIIDVSACGKPLVVVVNDALMDNHQLQVATKLHQYGCLVMCVASELHGGKLEALVEQVSKGEIEFKELPRASDKVVESIIAEEVER